MLQVKMGVRVCEIEATGGDALFCSIVYLGILDCNYPGGLIPGKIQIIYGQAFEQLQNVRCHPVCEEQAGCA